MREIEDRLRVTLREQPAPQLPSRDVFDRQVRQRIAARRRSRRLAVTATVMAIAIVGAGVVAALRRVDQDASLIDTQSPSVTVAVDGTEHTVTPTIAMIEVVGLDYRDAQRRVQPLHGRVLLALDADSAANEGTVTATTPAAGQAPPQGGALTIDVASP